MLYGIQSKIPVSIRKNINKMRLKCQKISDKKKQNTKTRKNSINTPISANVICSAVASSIAFSGAKESGGYIIYLPFLDFLVCGVDFCLESLFRVLLDFALVLDFGLDFVLLDCLVCGFALFVEGADVLLAFSAKPLSPNLLSSSDFTWSGWILYAARATRLW